MQSEPGNDAAVQDRPIKRLIAPIIGVVLAFCALCTFLLYDSHRAAGVRATDIATRLIAAMESDIARNIETVDLSLQGVVDNLKFPGIDRLDPNVRQMVLFDRSATIRHVGGAGAGRAVRFIQQEGAQRAETQDHADDRRDQSLDRAV